MRQEVASGGGRRRLGHFGAHREPAARSPSRVRDRRARTALAWEEPAAGSRAAAVLYDDVVPCEARLGTGAKRFYASMLGESEHLEPGEYRSPTWGFSGAPDIVPGPEGDEGGFPPAYWGTVHITKVTDTAVSGTMRFSSKGLALEGPFEAKRCPDGTTH